MLTVRIPPALFDRAKLIAVKKRMSLQKLVTAALERGVWALETDTWDREQATLDRARKKAERAQKGESR
jgi:hypothetical protein